MKAGNDVIRVPQALNMDGQPNAAPNDGARGYPARASPEAIPGVKGRPIPLFVHPTGDGLGD